MTYDYKKASVQDLHAMILAHGRVDDVLGEIRELANRAVDKKLVGPSSMTTIIDEADEIDLWRERMAARLKDLLRALASTGLAIGELSKRDNLLPDEACKIMRRQEGVEQAFRILKDMGFVLEDGKWQQPKGSSLDPALARYRLGKRCDALQEELNSIAKVVGPCKAPTSAAVEAIVKERDLAVRILNQMGFLRTESGWIPPQQAIESRTVAEAVEAARERRQLLQENHDLRRIATAAVNATDGGCSDSVSIEFLRGLPAEVASIKAQRDAARARLAALIGAVEKSVSAQRRREYESCFDCESYNKCSQDTGCERRSPSLLVPALAAAKKEATDG